MSTESNSVSITVSYAGLTSEQLNSAEKRLKLLTDNEYRLNPDWDFSNDFIKPKDEELARFKLYLIAEDTCFDMMGMKYEDGIIKRGNKIISQEEYLDLIDTYRHTYISAIYTKKYGKDLTKIITDAKEYMDSNPLRDHIKDFNNNAIGREIAKSIDNNLSFEEMNLQIVNKIEEADNSAKLIKDVNKIRPEHLDRIDTKEWYILRLRSKEGELVRGLRNIIAGFDSDYDDSEIMRALTEPMKAGVVREMANDVHKARGYLLTGAVMALLSGKPTVTTALLGTFILAEAVRSIPYSDPLLVDLDGDGIETTTLENGVYFDHAVDGFKELSAWVADDDGILVLDKNQNGIIDDGSEIFGDNYVKLDGTKATSGFDALSDFDLNNDGKITTDEFADIRVLKGDGTLLTLEDAGIQSINLTYTNKNKKDDLGNVQKTGGTFVKTDGKTGVIGDYLFANDSINTIATDWVEVPEDIAELPDIAGFGNVYSLHQAMARNSELKDLIQAFPSAPDARARLDFVKQIIYKWAGVENVPTDSRGPHYDGRDLAALEKFIGRGFVGMNTGNHQISPNPITNAAKILSNCFNMLQEYIYAELEAQTILKPLFEMLEFSFDETSDKFLYNISPVQNHIDNAISANPTDGKTLLLDFARTFVHLGLEENSNYADFKAHYAALGKEYELLLSSVDKINLYGTDQDDTIDGSSEQDAVFAYGGNDTITTRQGDDLVYAGDGDDNIDTCMGNDVIFGENGNDTIDAGEGNDYIDGGDGNDRIFSGKGDDTIIGGKGDDYMEDVKSGGNDTYIFNKGDGNDTISNWHGDDKIVFGEGIAPSNLKFIGDKKDIIIKFTDSPNDSIRIVNFVQYEDYRIETFEFADGSVLTADDVIADIVVEGTNSDDIIYGTTLADTIYGFDGNDKIYSQGGADRVFAGAGNDSIYNSNGNDFIDPGDGDDKVYTSNKFDETILGSKGNDYFEDLDGGNETFIFSAGDGIDTIHNKFGDNDTVRFEASVDKDNIALFVDRSGYLNIDYGTNAGEDIVKIKGQTTDIWAIENFEFADADGNLSTLSAADITKIIQDMTAFAAENEISITSAADVKDNPDLMNIIASSIAA